MARSNARRVDEKDRPHGRRLALSGLNHAIERRDLHPHIVDDREFDPHALHPAVFDPVADRPQPGDMAVAAVHRKPHQLAVQRPEPLRAGPERKHLVEQIGVKSAGWLNRITHLPL